MRFSIFDAVLYVCLIVCVMVAALECRAADCDTKCRYITIYAHDDGNGRYSCFNLKNDDCGICTGTWGAPTGGCVTILPLQNGSCKADTTLPQQFDVATSCNLACPLPPTGRTMARAIPGINYSAFGNTFTCQGGGGT